MFIDITCSTCGEKSRVATADERDMLRCPECGRSYDGDSSEDDRSRWKDLAIDDAVLGCCPHCKYFLGCVLRPDKRWFGERRFLGLKLSQREKATV